MAVWTLNFNVNISVILGFLQRACFSLIIKETVDNIQALFPQALKKLVGEEEDGLRLLADEISFNLPGCATGGF